MLQFINVHKRYPDGTEALRGVEFELASGEMVFLTGHSGAGKSTVLKLITLQEKVTRGQVKLNDQNLQKLRKKHINQLRRRMGFIFQDPQLLTDRTVFDNVALPLVIANLTHGEVAKRARAALDKVGLLHKANCLPKALSCGEQQRVGIARAVVNKPDLIVADEPTGNLDPDLSADIMRLFAQFNQVGVSILMATHDVNLIQALPHRVLTLDKGKIAA